MKSGKIVNGVAGTIIRIALIVLAIALLYKLLMFSYDVGYRIFAEEPMGREPGISKSVSIGEGKSAREIGKILEEKGLIRDGWMFAIQEQLSDYHDCLQPGVYELSTAMTSYQMMEIMAQGPQEETVTKSALDTLTEKEANMDFDEEQPDDGEFVEGDDYVEDDADGTEEADDGE